jgi:succinate-semialdehyde dehydrogenase / glutarate-semialdehyde dehydrogenase
MNLKNPDLFRQQNYINGTWVDADSGKTTAVHNPATGELLGHVPRCGADETRRAIEAAQVAQKAWKKRTAVERMKIMRAFAEIIMANQKDLAVILTTEQGKPLTESMAEIAIGASYIDWFANEARRVYGDVIPSYANDRRMLAVKEPIGVCAGITPWNFPSSMITRKASAALATGNVMVLKPAGQTPFSALALAVLAEQAGIPAGVLSILTGDSRQIGGELTSNPIVRKLSFTGSTEIGKLLAQQCATTVKRLSLELGGNAPFIVFDDADLDAAVQGAIVSKYRNAGQTCICTNRFLIQDGVYDAFAEKYMASVNKLNVGNGLDEGVNVGPLIDEEAISKVRRLQEDAVAMGAKVTLGGERLARAGTFYAPTVLLDVTPEMTVSSEEIFGPISSLMRFKTEDEAIAMANDTPYGLAAYFYSRDVGRVWRVGEGLEYGMVGINTGLFVNESAPFGGMKESGYGREGSRHGVDDWLEIKYMCVAGVM